MEGTGNIISEDGLRRDQILSVRRNCPLSWRASQVVQHLPPKARI
jgi:hypothetical protein